MYLFCHFLWMNYQFILKYVKVKETTVRKIKADREMGARYMTFQQLIKDERKEAFAEGKAEGEISKLVAQIKIKLSKGQSVGQIADALEESVETIEELIKAYL